MDDHAIPSVGPIKVCKMPERFWVVVRPTGLSELGDICFECDFRRYALQIRGGLDEETIVGVYVDEQEAKRVAEELLRERDAGRGS